MKTDEKESAFCSVWWKEAIIYQIYPRSFKDSDGDGIGDLKGIISRLDYVRSLGVDVIWLNPVFASPNDDNGYDISDYRDIMRDFGTMADFDRLLQEIHARGMKLLLDLVVNHTSDEHPWFVQARTSRENPYYDFYIWWPAEHGAPPDRRSFFDERGDAWRYNPATDSYYLHYFSVRQPDLNWDNPEVRREIYEIMNFWFAKGIDGFRLDSIPYISKDMAHPVIDECAYPGLFGFYSQGPRLHEYLREMNREVLSHYDCVSVGEGSGVEASEAWKFVSPERQELDMLYGFGPSDVRNKTRPDSRRAGVSYSLVSLKRMFTEWDWGVRDGWPTVYLGNHDQPRMLSRFGSDRRPWREVSAKMLATFLLTMRGTPCWYAGDEIGMANVRFSCIDHYNDIQTRNMYGRIERAGGDTKAFLREQKHTARDNARTPFQWDASPCAGFSAAAPWLRVNPDCRRVNAAAQEDDPDSVLNYFRRAVAFRKANNGLIYGDYTLLDAGNLQTYTYLREGEGQQFLVALNFSRKPGRAFPGLSLDGAEKVLWNYPDTYSLFGTNSAEGIPLRPFEAVVYRLG